MGWFIAVGGVAAVVHLAVVTLLVEHAALAPLCANVAGWAVAFGVSFSGHRALSFRTQNAPLGRSAARFLAVSASGFVVNETAYAGLLTWGGLGYRIALALVLVGVAGFTWWAGRYWAFAGSPAPQPARAVSDRHATGRPDRSA